MITDEMIHGSWAGLRETTRKSRSNLRCSAAMPVRSEPIRLEFQRSGEPRPKGVRIDWDTPIIPQIVAEGVCEEVQAWLKTPLPHRWRRELVGYANTVYAHNKRFRRRIRSNGNRGRDYLWMFMRHWLASLLKDRRYDFFVRLPASYSVGRELPGWSSPAPGRPEFLLS